MPLARVARPPPPPPPLGVLVRRAADERGVDARVLVERVLEAARRALPAVFGEGRRVEVSFDEEAGELRLWCVAIADEQAKTFGPLLAWDDEWARSLETWRSLYRNIVAAALREA